jgi:hypothetical protein
MKVSQYQQLLQLGRLLFELQEQAGVSHQYGNLLRGRLGSRYAEVADLLLCQLTLLRRTSRRYDKRAYHAEAEDLAATMQLLLGEIKGSGVLSHNGNMALHQLSEGLAPGQWFRRSDVQRLTKYGKTQSWRWLQRWERQGKVRRVAGNANTGYFYRLEEE